MFIEDLANNILEVEVGLGLIVDEDVGLEDTRSSSSRTLSSRSSSSYLRTSEYHFRRNSEVEWLAVYSLGSTTYSSAPCSNTFSLYLFPRDGGELSRIYPASLKPPSHTSYDSRQKSRPVTGPASNPIVIFVSGSTMVYPPWAIFSFATLK
mgnify:CR=1 FL=1